MAELTYDPTPADNPEFNQSELEALQLGEQAQSAENQMLAGKFRSPEDLEQAYIELQRKLGESNGDVPTPSDEGQEEFAAEEEVELNEVDQFVMSASEEYYSNNGELSQETFDQLSQMESSDLINAYLKAQANQPAPVSADLTPEDANSIQNVAGGTEAYNNLLQWAGETLPEPMIDSFDALVESGNPGAIQLAVRGLMAEYEAMNGSDGQLLTGRGPIETQDVFRSQSEVVQAMSDPRYDRDPAYRNDVFEKIARSNVPY